MLPKGYLVISAFKALLRIGDFLYAILLRGLIKQVIVFRSLSSCGNRQVTTKEIDHNLDHKHFQGLKEVRDHRGTTRQTMSAADNLRESFFAMAKRVESLSGLIDPSRPETLLNAQATLNAVISDLESMVLVGDRMESEPGAGPSNLITEIRALLEQTRGLKTHIDKAIVIQGGLSDDAEAAAQQETTDEEPQGERDTVREFVTSQGDVPLDRQEIAKLLLLISRAEKGGVLSKKQKDFLKTQVVARVGMLRVILQLSGIEMIMQALKAISGEEE